MFLASALGVGNLLRKADVSRGRSCGLFLGVAEVGSEAAAEPELFGRAIPPKLIHPRFIILTFPNKLF